MNEKINTFLLKGDKPGFTYSACESFSKIEERIQKLQKDPKKQGIQDIFIKGNKIMLGFSMTWLMDILRIFPED